jgi:hypothetical protein
VRQGLQRLETLQQAQRNDRCPVQSGSRDPGFLVLEAVPAEARSTVTQNLAR